MKLPGIAVATLAITALAGGTALAQATMQPIPNPPEKEHPMAGHHRHHGHHHHMKGHHHHMKGHHHHHMKAAPKEDEAAPAPAPATPQ